MTPFAQLALMEKSAMMGAGYAAPGQGGMVRPPAWGSPQSSAAGAVAGAAAKPKGQWGVINNTWGDIGMSSIPIVGGVYMANRAIQDFRQGNIGSGIGNALWSAISFVPGGGLLKGVAGGLKGLARGAKLSKGVMGAAKPAIGAMSGINRAQHVARNGWRGMQAAGKTLPGGGGLKTYGTAMGASIAAPMLLDPKQPQQQPPQQQFNPYEPQPQGQQSWIQMGREQLGH